MRSLRPLATYELESEVGNNLQSEPTFNTDNNAHRMFLYTSSIFEFPARTNTTPSRTDPTISSQNTGEPCSTL